MKKPRKTSGKSNIDIVKDYLAGVRPFTQVGYTGDVNHYRENGEKWIDIHGVEWEKRDGKSIRLTRTQGDIIREAIGDGQSCKKCKLQLKWGNRQDSKLIRRTGLCVECLTDYETKLRILGLYEAYERYHLASHELGYLKEAKEKIKETIEYFERTDGDITKLAETEHDQNIVWKNTNKDKILTDARQDLEKVEQLIATGSLAVPQWKQEYVDGVKKYNIEAYV